MALTKKRREEIADQLDTVASWFTHSGRAGKVRALAQELRGEEVTEGESPEAVQARIDEATAKEVEAQRVAAEKAQTEIARQAETAETPSA